MEAIENMKEQLRKPYQYREPVLIVSPFVLFHIRLRERKDEAIRMNKIKTSKKKSFRRRKIN